MKFILTTMAFVAAVAMGAIATSQEAATATVTVFVTNCDTSVAGVSTSIRTLSGSDIITSATESIAPTPVGPVSESVLSTSFHSDSEATSSATIGVVIESATSTISNPVGITSVGTGMLTSIVMSSNEVSPVTASTALSTSLESASASESNLPSASKSSPAFHSSATPAVATSTSVPSNDATAPGMVGMTCIMAMVAAAALFNLA